MPPKYSYLQNLGITHNEIIQSYYFANQPLSNYYNQLSENNKYFFNSTLYEKCRGNIQNYGVKYAQDGFNFPNYSSNLLKEGYISINVKEVLDLFMQEYIKCRQSSDIESIVNFYIDNVNKSDLLDTDKTALISGFMVASESPFYLLIP